MKLLNKLFLIIIFTSLIVVTAGNNIYPQFVKNVGGSSDDYGYSIAVDGSGNVYVTGKFQGTADFDPGAGTTNLTSAGNTDVFFAKYNSSGALVWAKNVGGSSIDDGHSIAVDGSGNVYIMGFFSDTADFDPDAGTTNLTSAGSYDVFFAKYNSSGALVWAKSLGGSSIDDGHSIAVDGSGNVYITGEFQGTVDFDPGAGTTNLTSAGSYDVFFAKYNSSGALVWAKNVGGFSADYGRSIAVDGSGNVYVAGSFTVTADFDPDTGTTNLTSAGSGDVFFAKYNSSGALVWAKNVGASYNDEALSIAVDGSGNIYVTGFFKRTADFDPGTGTTNLTSAGYNDAFFAKYNSSGAMVWAKNVGGTDYDVGYSIAVDGSGNVYVTGYFIGTVDFDPGTGTTNLTSTAGRDVFFAKYNSSGALVWAKNVGGSSNDYGQSIAVDGSGNVYITGYFAGTADFDPDAGTTNLTSAGGNDVFFAKYDENGSLIITGIENGAGIPISYSLSQNFPNPFNPSTIIRYELPQESNISIAIYNILGQQIIGLVSRTQSAGYHEVTFNAGNLSSGIYLYRIIAVSADRSNTFIDTKKLILMK